MTPNITDIFTDHLYSISACILPPEVVDQAEMCIIDYRGCVLAGAGLIAKKGESFLDAVSSQGGNCTIPGFARRTTVQNAALLGAMCAHSTELDDGHRFGMIHLGASILSALLPVAEVEDLTHEALLKGIVAGYDAAIRLAMAMQPSHKLRGYHASGTCGTIGSAVAISIAMGLSRDQLKSAIAAGAASAAGLLEMQEDNSDLKPYNLAQAAVCGINAAYSAKAGFIGPDDPLGGRRGMLAVMSHDPDFSALSEYDSHPYEILRIYRKIYAACRHCHPAIEGALEIKNSAGLDSSEIAGIHIRTYRLAVAGHDHKDISGIASAKLSMPFSVALALVKGHAGHADFTENSINDPTITALMEKVSICEDEEISSWCPEKRAAIVEIVADDGRTFTSEVDFPKGEPENPVSREDLNDKFALI